MTYRAVLLHKAKSNVYIIKYKYILEIFVHVFINILNPYMQYYFIIIKKKKKKTSFLYCTFSQCYSITHNFVCV